MPASLGGILYVIEGATLGGSQIDGAARKLLRDEHPAGRRYWSWCRATCKDRWKMASECLDQCVADGVAISDLKKGATETFEVFADWLAPLDRALWAAEPGRANHG
jgi:heme oxygenase